MTDEQRFESIRKRALKASERLEACEDTLRRKYGQTRPPAAWLTRTEEARCEAVYAAQTKAWNDMFELLTRISSRKWDTGIAAWWVVECLTYADAIADGPLSVVPKPGYGYTQADAERFAA